MQFVVTYGIVKQVSVTLGRLGTMAQVWKFWEAYEGIRLRSASKYLFFD